MDRTVFSDAGKLLVFRLSVPEFERFGRGHLILGLVLTWLAGIGRWWDDPRAPLLLHLGFGSLAYVVVLAGVLTMIVAPLRPRRWSYLNGLTFVTLTAPPAFLYAIPVERFTTPATAYALNACLLGIVAVWRVALLCFYLHRYAGLNAFRTAVAFLFPASVVLTYFTLMDIMKQIAETMGGMEGNHAPNTVFDTILLALKIGAFYGCVPLFITYLVLIERSAKIKAAKDEAVPTNPPQA